MVAGLGEVEERICHRRGAAGHGQCGHATLECGHALLEHLLRGVGEASVYVARLLEVKAVGGVLRVVENV